MVLHRAVEREGMQQLLGDKSDRDWRRRGVRATWQGHSGWGRGDSSAGTEVEGPE